MILDLTDQVLVSYSPTSTGSTIQNYIDRLAKMEDGNGADLYGYIQVAATATSGGSATVQFKVIGNATDPTFASGNKTLADSGAIAVATLVAGWQIPLKINHQQMPSLEPTTSFYRYVTIQVTIGTAALTAGTFNGWIATLAPQDNLSYPSGYTALG